MASQALLKAIPKGVHVVRNMWILDHFFVHCQRSQLSGVARARLHPDFPLPYHLRPIATAVSLCAGLC